jgi:pyrimidine-nucleoside phosphorylase
MAFHPSHFIAKKRDGGEHTSGEIMAMVTAFSNGNFTDYQMTAWLMAVFLNGMSPAETVALTAAMMNSGKVIQRKSSGQPRIDKHSTGGVGDKISLPLAPLVASCGVFVPMIAGRGLGHTGGTVDKLASIPGYQTQLSLARFERIVAKVGTSIVGQSKEIAPVDRQTYALRDVTGTVACRPLIVASILSKKLAEGLDGLVLDVKVGRGAFMKTFDEAIKLAEDLASVASELGSSVRCRLTDMDAPLGRTIGNALEIRETIEILQGKGPEDSTELTLALAEDMLLLGKVKRTRGSARRLLEEKLGSGEALSVFQKMVQAHGGDPRIIDEPLRLPTAKEQTLIRSPRSGTVHSIDPLALAHLALDLGAGRRRAEDTIDPAVGIELHVKRGQVVRKGDKIATLHQQSRVADHVQRTQDAFRIKSGQIQLTPLTLGVVEKSTRRHPKR